MSRARRKSLRIARLCLGSVLLGIVLWGCGGSSGDGTPSTNALAVSKTIHDYYTAIVQGDGKAACAFLTSSQQHAIAAQTPRDDDCVEYLSSEVFPSHNKRYFQIGKHVVYAKDIPGLDVDVALKGTHARARPRGGTASFGLTKIEGTWRISDLGLGQ